MSIKLDGPPRKKEPAPRSAENPPDGDFALPRTAAPTAQGFRDRGRVKKAARDRTVANPGSCDRRVSPSVGPISRHGPAGRPPLLSADFVAGRVVHGKRAGARNKPLPWSGASPDRFFLYAEGRPLRGRCAADLPRALGLFLRLPRRVGDLICRGTAGRFRSVWGRMELRAWLSLCGDDESWTVEAGFLFFEEFKGLVYSFIVVKKY